MSRSAPERPVVETAATVAWLLLLAGMALHHSRHPALLGRYSRSYALGLLAIAALTPFVRWAARILAGATARQRLLVAAATVSAWLVAEVAVGGLRPGSPGRFRFVPHPSLQAVPAPWPGSGVNAHGFRGPELVSPKPPGLVRVALLGGSTSFCPNLDFADSYGSRLEAELATRLAPRSVEVQSAGVPTYTTAQDVLRYAGDVADVEPDAVVVMEAINDLRACVDSERLSVGGEPGFDTRDLLLPPRRRLLAGLLSRAAADTLFSDLRPRAPAAWTPADPRPFRTNLRAIVVLARERGQRIVLATQPHLFREDATPEGRRRAEAALASPANPGRLPGFLWFCDGMRRLNEATRALAAEEGVPLLDLEREVARAELFDDEVHVNATGARLEARLAARLLAEALQRETRSR